MRSSVRGWRVKSRKLSAFATSMACLQCRSITSYTQKTSLLHRGSIGCELPHISTTRTLKSRSLYALCLRPNDYRSLVLFGLHGTYTTSSWFGSVAHTRLAIGTQRNPRITTLFLLKWPKSPCWHGHCDKEETEQEV